MQIKQKAEIHVYANSLLKLKVTNKAELDTKYLERQQSDTYIFLYSQDGLWLLDQQLTFLPPTTHQISLSTQKSDHSFVYS